MTRRVIGTSARWNFMPPPGRKRRGQGRRTRRAAGTKPSLAQRAAGMRNNPTHAERKLGNALRPIGYAVKAQHVMPPFIVDFYFPDALLVVEVDGASHLGPEAERYDERRTGLLQRRYGVTVIRVTNHQVFHDIASATAYIRAEVDRRLPRGQR